MNFIICSAVMLESPSTSSINSLPLISSVLLTNTFSAELVVSIVKKDS